MPSIRKIRYISPYKNTYNTDFKLPKDVERFNEFWRVEQNWRRLHVLFVQMLQGGQSSGSGLKNARVRGLLSTFAFPAMNNKENETGYKFSSDQTLEKMYVLLECIRYKGYNQTFSHLLIRSILIFKYCQTEASHKSVLHFSRTVRSLL